MLLPKTNPYVPGDISIFNTLVSAGEEKSCIALPYHLRGFLVDCLVEHVRDREIVHTVLALSLLHSAEKLGEQGNVLLKQTGDGALLLAGLFPKEPFGSTSALATSASLDKPRIQILPRSSR